MRIRTLLGAGAAVLATGLGLVVAQDAAVPPVQSPPEEAAPPPGGATPTSPAPAPTSPGYTVLGPSARGEGDGDRDSRPAARSTRPVPAPTEPGEPAPTVARPRHTGALLQAVDKVTAETLRFEVKVGKPVRYKTLVFTVRACETEASDELIKESAAHVTITSQPKAQPGRVLPDPAQVYRGWMFASSPGLNPFEHPVYDAWLVACTPTPPSATPRVSPVPTPPTPRLPQTQATAPAATPPG